jgi:hypothetical protein
MAERKRPTQNDKNDKKRQKRKKESRVHTYYIPIEKNTSRRQRLSCLFCLGRKNVTTDIERDGLVVVVVAHERTDDLVIIIATKIARERKGKGNIAATTDDRSRCVERTKREAMSPSSLLSDSRVLLHLRDA